MDIYTKPGEKVRFTNPEAGYQGDIETVKKHLQVGETYTVMDVEVEDWDSRVTFVETGSDVSFNTVHFENE